MKRLLSSIGILTLVFGSVPLLASDLLSLSASNLVFVQSSDAPGEIDRERLRTCQRQMAEEMKVVGKAMPLVMVAHVSQSTGEALGVKQSKVRRNSGLGGDMYYELWLVGPVGLTEYIRGMETVLELHFELHYTELERTTIMARVLRRVRATVNAKSYRE